MTTHGNFALLGTSASAVSTASLGHMCENKIYKYAYCLVKMPIFANIIHVCTLSNLYLQTYYSIKATAFLLGQSWTNGMKSEL